MSDLTITYDTFTFEITPSFKPQIRQEFDENNEPIAYIESWPLEGFITPDDGIALADLPEHINDKWEELKDAFIGNDEKDAVLKDASGTTLQTLLAVDSDDGPRITDGPTIIDPFNGLYLTNLKFRVTLESRKKITRTGRSAKLLEDTQRTTYETDQCGILTRTVEGSLRTIAGVSALAEATLKDPGTPFSYIRVSKRVAPDTPGDRSATYTFVDKFQQERFPSGACDGSMATTESIVNGVKTTRVSGNFHGEEHRLSLARRAVKKVKPRGKVFSVNETTENKYSGSIDFTFEHRESASGKDPHLHIEASSFRTENHLENIKIKGKGAKDYRQKTANPTRTASVSGRRESFKSFPAAPPHIYPATDLDEEEISYSYEKDSTGRKAIVFITEWSRAYKLLTVTDAKKPNIN